MKPEMKPYETEQQYIKRLRDTCDMGLLEAVKNARIEAIKKAIINAADTEDIKAILLRMLTGK